MTSTVIEGHKSSPLCLFNLNLRSYGQLFVLVLEMHTKIYSDYPSKYNQKFF